MIQSNVFFLDLPLPDYPVYIWFRKKKGTDGRKWDCRITQDLFVVCNHEDIMQVDVEEQTAGPRVINFTVGQQQKVIEQITSVFQLRSF